MPAEEAVIAPAIHIQDVSLSYQGTPVFAPLNLTLRAGKWTALLGASGVGKSSLLRLMAGLNTADELSSGTITADNDSTVSQQIAWMAQTDMLLPWLTVLDNLLLGIKLRGVAKKEKTASIIRARTLLSQAGLSHAENSYPHQLSGGMRQRVALLRTLMEDKPVVLMDEPFSALDTITRYQLHEMAVYLLRDKTVLLVTHDPAEALRLADDSYLLTAQGLKHLASLDSPTPRLPHELSFVNLQKKIHETLLQTAGAAA